MAEPPRPPPLTAAGKVEVNPEPLDYPYPYPDPDYLTPAPPSPSPDAPKPPLIPARRRRRRLRPLLPRPILQVNRRRLTGILRTLTRSHSWRTAAAVLSVLLQGARRVSYAEDRTRFRVAMEVIKRLGARDKYQYQLMIKQIYEVQMARLAWTKRGDKRKHEISLELVLFYISQGAIDSARDSMRFLIEDPDSANVPIVNLIYGLILYQLWYSHLFKDMKANGFTLSMPSKTNGMPFKDDTGESETLESSNGTPFKDDTGESETPESSNGYNTLDIEDVRFASQCASESSVGNMKNVFLDCKNNLPAKQNASQADEFYMSRSLDVIEEGVASLNHDINLGSSIFLAHGLDTSLLPIHLKHTSGDLEKVISTYRKLANENYRDAVKHLRLALYSRQPLFAALQPLIQLLMLGDRVEEALKELEKFCDYSNMALPFRLRARLLEVFHNNQTTMISTCYENVLKRDPICNQSLEALIKMHKTGYYNSLLLLEMIALHLDAVSGNSSVWQEFASCFLKLLGGPLSEFEDCISVNYYKDQTNNISSRKVPKVLTEGQTRDTWRIRCKWWVTRHFSNISCFSELKEGDWDLLTSKAACASHLYGPRFEYVITVHSSLRNEGKNDHMSFLSTHMQRSMELHEGLV